MSASDIPFSRIGGAANSGSTKPAQEREEIERDQPGRDEKDKPATPQGTDESRVTPSAPQSGIGEGPADSSRE